MAVLDWLHSHMKDTVQVTGDEHEAHTNCPFCTDTRRRFYIKLSNGVCYCHNCGTHLNFPALVHRIEGLDFQDATALANEITHDAYVKPTDTDESMTESLYSRMLIAAMNIKIEIPKQEMPLPDNTIPFTEKVWVGNDKMYRDYALKYLKSRGFTKQDAVQAGMGVCVEGRYQGRVIIPIKNGTGMTEFFVARSIDPDAKLKELSPHAEYNQYSKSEVIYNLDQAVANYKAIVISEGIYDAMSWGGMGVSLLGKRMSRKQFERLRPKLKHLDAVFIALDADATEQVIQLAEMLKSYVKVYIVRIPPEDDDPNLYMRRHGRGSMMHLLDTAVEYSITTRLKLQLKIPA